MRYRLVVLEGPDGGGKTTLARFLQEHLGYTVRHEGPPPADREDVFEYYVGRLTMALSETFAEPGVVLDRFALGERVYGPVLRGRDRLGAQGWRRVRDCLDSVGALRVVCLPPRAQALRAWREGRTSKGELFHDEALFHQAYDAWEDLRGDRGQIHYDWTRQQDGPLPTHFSADAVARLVRGR